MSTTTIQAPTAEAVTAELTAWLDDNWDPEITLAEWWTRLAVGRWAHPAMPEEAGGRGYGRSLCAAIATCMANAGVVGPPIGLGPMLAAPTIAAHGTPEQIQQFVPEILDGSVAWCQLFSEPNAGSDLAGLQTKAVRDGDEWTITGQKVWTSGGHLAKWGMLIARTDPDAPKHQGITYFAFDMEQPGVEVRPLREMTGAALFNEVFIDGAKVLDANVIGGLGNGWRVANTTLMIERANLGGGGKQPPSLSGGHQTGRLGDAVGELAKRTVGGPDGEAGRGMSIKRLLGLAADMGCSDDPVVRQEIVKLHILGEVNNWNLLRAKAGGSRTGAEGNLAKLAMSELVRHSREVGNLVIGADGMLAGSASSTGGGVQEVTLFSPGPAIYGGTDQVQRNIIGERVLGLPKEPGHPKETPFKDLPQN